MTSSGIAKSRAQAAGFVRLEAWARDAAAAERVAAEAFEAGALGLEERDETDGGTWLLLYAAAGDGEALARALARCADAERPRGPVPVAQEDWSEAWKAGLSAVQVSPRLWVRPSFVPPEPAPGRVEVVIDPGQAFGTGGHCSTRLALEGVDRLAPSLAAGARVLDVGCGSGVLALAALRRGAARAVGIDIDPVAAREARANAAANGLADRLAVVAGGLDALAPQRFALVLANLLRTELLPLLPGLAAHTARGGRAVLSGLLAAEGAEVRQAAAAAGLATEAVSQARDAGGESWIALVTVR